MLVAYPLESWLAITPSAFDRRAFTETPQLVDLLYRAIRDASAAKPLLSTDHPSVEAIALKGNRRAYAVVVNDGAQPRKVTVTTTLPFQTLRRLRPEGPEPIAATGSRFTLELGAWDGAVVEMR